MDYVASQITKECNAMKGKRDSYHLNIDKDLACEAVSDTTAKLLSKISREFGQESVAMILIGNIITSEICCQPTDL